MQHHSCKTWCSTTFRMKLTLSISTRMLQKWIVWQVLLLMKFHLISMLSGYVGERWLWLRVSEELWNSLNNLKRFDTFQVGPIHSTLQLGRLSILNSSRKRVSMDLLRNSSTCTWFPVSFTFCINNIGKCWNEFSRWRSLWRGWDLSFSSCDISRQWSTSGVGWERHLPILDPVVESPRWFIANTQTLPLAQDSKIARLDETWYFRELWVWPGLIIPVLPIIYLRYDGISVEGDVLSSGSNLTAFILFLSLYYRYLTMLWIYFFPCHLLAPFQNLCEADWTRIYPLISHNLHPRSYYPIRLHFDGHFNSFQGSVLCAFTIDRRKKQFEISHRATLSSVIMIIKQMKLDSRYQHWIKTRIKLRQISPTLSKAMCGPGCQARLGSSFFQFTPETQGCDRIKFSTERLLRSWNGLFYLSSESFHAVECRLAIGG